MLTTMELRPENPMLVPVIEDEKIPAWPSSRILRENYSLPFVRDAYRKPVQQQNALTNLFGSRANKLAATCILSNFGPEAT